MILGMVDDVERLYEDHEINSSGGHSKTHMKKCLTNSIFPHYFVFLVILFVVLLLFSVFFVHKKTRLADELSQKVQLEKQNTFLAQQLAWSHDTIDALSNGSISLLQEISQLKENNEQLISRISQQRDNIMAIFEAQFRKYTDKLHEYATFTFSRIVDWDQGEVVCRGVDGLLAVPGDYSAFESIGEVCDRTEACWIGLTKQGDGKTWKSAAGDVFNVMSGHLKWASGQPSKKEGADCVYVLQKLLYSFKCDGSTGQNHSHITVGEHFICQKGASLAEVVN